MKSAFFILEMWQTGNVGPHNIAKTEKQPKEGFKTYKDAEDWLKKNVGELTPLWETFIISKVYST